VLLSFLIVFVGVKHYRDVDCGGSISFGRAFGAGVLMMLIGIIYFYELWKKKDLLSKPWFLKTFIWATPLGFIALEAGWTVTEIGRQPWIIQGVMRTSEAVTPMPGIQYSFYLFSFIYFTLSLAVIFLLQRQIKMVPEIYDVKK